MGRLNLKAGDYIKVITESELYGMTQGRVYRVIEADDIKFWFINDDGEKDWYLSGDVYFELADDFILKQIWG